MENKDNTIEKIELKSPDFTKENIKKLIELFPEVETEREDENGNIVKAIDFDILKQALSEDVIEGGEKYEFTWPGKKKSFAEANRPTTMTLRPDLESSKNWDTTENIYIEGDNLEALKILQNSYMGKIKMIYIDPPYNTGNDFVYNDDFRMKKEEYDAEVEVYDDDGNKLFKNTTSNGRFHSDWCSMIYPRLKLARNLLSDDGVIFISIDDNELDNLRKICDEIFGAQNFISTYKWNRTSTPPSLSKKVRLKYEYVLCYEKNKSEIKYNGGVSEGGDMPLLNEGNTIRTVRIPRKNITFTFDGYYNSGKYERVTLEEEIIIKNGIPDKNVILTGPFKWTQDTINTEIKNGTHIIIKSSKFAPRYIREGERIKRPSDIISKTECGVGTNEDAKKEILKLFKTGVMSYPKPSSLIKYLIPFAELNKESIILDFFSGSATTADAVMQLNAEDGGNRKFIMVQLPELTDEKSEAYKAGYKTIADIGRERIRRAGEKILEDNKDKVGIDNLDIGFRAFKIDEGFHKDVYRKASELTQMDIMDLESNIREDRDALDLLFATLLGWGVAIDKEYKSFDIDGYRVYDYDDGAIIACFEDNIPEDVIRKIAKIDSEYVVFRDSSFGSSSEKINAIEIFKTISSNPDKVRVI